MAQTPFGGLSLIINIIIILFGLAINYLKKRTFTNAIISHKQIFRLESTQIGKIITPAIAIVIPLFVFVSVFTTSVGAIKYLYNDADKITAYDIGLKGEGFAEEGYRYIEARASRGAVAYVDRFKSKDTFPYEYQDFDQKGTGITSKVHTIYSALSTKDMLKRQNEPGTYQLFLEGITKEKNFLEKINQEITRIVPVRITNNL